MRSISMVVLGTSLFLHDAWAQGIVCSLGPMAPGYRASADQAAPPRVARDLKRIVGLLCPKGCGRIGLFKNATTSSAVAMNVGNGTSKIAYSAAFLDRIQEAYGSDASFGILAHEVGHHVDVNGSPAAWMDPSWNTEVRADAWAGCALAKAGMRIEGLHGALRVVVAPAGSGPNPGWELRATAMQRGYNNCAGAGLKLAAAAQTVLASNIKVGGCASNYECRAGRLCLEGRCQDRAARGVCLKDIDCPEQQICGATGRCDAPAGISRQEPGVKVVSLAQEDARPTFADCRKQCDADRRRCRVAAVKALNTCLGRVRADAEYVGCACPNWPASKPECHKICEDAFETAEGCEVDYVPTRESCLSSVADCGGCDSTPGSKRVSSREATLK